MTREVNRLTRLIMLVFMVLAGSTAYWNITQRDNLARREDNPRRVLYELNIARGRIFDRNGEVLALSEPHPSRPEQQRRYPYPEVVSAVGYYSYQYGASAVEEAYNDFLLGKGLRSPAGRWWDEALNRPQQGGDVRTTLDIRIQLALAEAMQGYRGAGVVVHVPSGDILAMTSQPGYDPNTINLIWEQLEPDRLNSPLLNRVTTGRYQPGGALQILLLSEMLASGQSLNAPASAEAVTLDDGLEITCTYPPEEPITLAAAFAAACPDAFVQAMQGRISVTSFSNRLDAAGWWQTPQLRGFDLPQRFNLFYLGDSPADNLANATGQGRLTVTPLHMVQSVAALLNGGNGVSLNIVEATRAPGEDWEALPAMPPPPAIMQPAVAASIQGALLEHPWAENIYGHASRAYAGERQYAWFLGWTPLSDGTYAAIVIVLESGAVQPQAAVSAGLSVLEAARENLTDLPDSRNP